MLAAERGDVGEMQRQLSLGASPNARDAQRRSALMIDPGPLGTTCARVGCMPSKLLIAAADAAHEARHGGVFGVHAHAEAANITYLGKFSVFLFTELRSLRLTTFLSFRFELILALMVVNVPPSTTGTPSTTTVSTHSPFSQNTNW